ncbi:hypothetical protein B0H66DRAFT_104681, partial [Apodospora peruviana]
MLQNIDDESTTGRLKSNNFEGLNTRNLEASQQHPTCRSRCPTRATISVSGNSDSGIQGMAPNSAREPARASNGNGTGANAAPAPASDDVLPIGPPSGLSSIPTQYIQEQSLRQMLKNIGYDEAREDTYRLKGVQLIDTVRQSLQLLVTS